MYEHYFHILNPQGLKYIPRMILNEVAYSNMALSFFLLNI